MKNELKIRTGYHYTSGWLYKKRIIKEGLIPKTNLLLEMLPLELPPLLEKEFAIKPLRKRFRTAQERYQEIIKDFLALERKEYVMVTKGLLEPRPKEWEENHEFNTKYNTLFNNLLESVIGFNPLMDDYIPNDYELALLSFPITSKTKAYVVDDAHIFRIRQINPQAKIIDKLNIIKRQVMRYTDTKIPVFEYKTGQHSIPVLCIEDAINSKDIKIEWIKPAREIKDLEFVM